MKRNLILLLTLCHSTLLIYSQNTTNSPTSMFGLGELSTGEGGQYSGLGGAGIALQSYNFLNTANPASLTAIEGQRFLIDAGVMEAMPSHWIRTSREPAVPPYRHSSKAKADCLKWESVQPIGFSRDFLSALTFPT